MHIKSEIHGKLFKAVAWLKTKRNRKESLSLSYFFRTFLIGRFHEVDGECSSKVQISDHNSGRINQFSHREVNVVYSNE